jgi:hypothetical protein
MVSRVPARAEWKALETVHARAKADVRLASPENDWDVIAGSRFRLGQVDINLPPLQVPAYGISYGERLTLQRTLHGRRTSGSVAPGQLAVLPPDADTRWLFDKNRRHRPRLPVSRSAGAGDRGRRRPRSAVGRDRSALPDS